MAVYTTLLLNWLLYFLERINAATNLTSTDMTSIILTLVHSFCIASVLTLFISLSYQTALQSILRDVQVDKAWWIMNVSARGERPHFAPLPLLLSLWAPHSSLFKLAPIHQSLLRRNSAEWKSALCWWKSLLFYPLWDIKLQFTQMSQQVCGPPIPEEDKCCN